MSRVSVFMLQNENRELKKDIENCQETNGKLNQLLWQKHAQEERLKQMIQGFRDRSAARFQEMNEEKKTLERMHRQKVAEVEKLTQRVRKLEKDINDRPVSETLLDNYRKKCQELQNNVKAQNQRLKENADKAAQVENLTQKVKKLEKDVLVGDAAARSVRDYKQKFEEMNEERKSLEQMHKQKVDEVKNLTQTVQELEEAVLAGGVTANTLRDYQQKFQEMNEERKNLEQMHMKKVAEVEKLTQRIYELEKAVLAGGAHAENILRDYQQKFQEMNEERKTLEQELAHAKVIANRVATVVANEWKDGNDKLMPVKQWLEERRFLQGEMQQLRDRLAITDRAAKSEAQLKEKFQMKLQELEETQRGTCTIEMLAKKVETLTNVMEFEAKNIIREVAAMEKEVAALSVLKDHKVIIRGKCVYCGSHIVRH